MFRVIMKNKLIIYDSYFILTFDGILQRMSNLDPFAPLRRFIQDTLILSSFSLEIWKLYDIF